MKQPRGGAAGDLMFFIFFIIVLGIVWALTGGPERSISTSGPFLSPPFGERSSDGIPSVDIPDQGTRDNPLNAFTNPFAGLTEKKSPYASAIRLSAGRARSAGADEEYVRIESTDDLAAPVNISSWKLVSSETQYEATLGEASPLPYSGRVNDQYVVMLPAESTVYVVTGRSPIGTSFRTNVCTGYFTQFQDFEPGLDKKCPLAEDELAERGLAVSEECKAYVEDINRCTLTTGTVPGNLGEVCRDFILNDLTYAGCVARHQDEPGFYNNEWRLYLNRTSELWKNANERIRLVDESGLLIDSVSY